MSRFLVLAAGERVFVTWRQKTVQAVVFLVSSNGKSVAFVFDGMLDGYCGGIALLWKGDRQWNDEYPQEGEYYDVFHGEPAVVTRVEDHVR